MNCVESPKQLTSSALQIQSTAIGLGRGISGDNSELNRWMAIAKQREMKIRRTLLFQTLRSSLGKRALAEWSSCLSSANAFSMRFRSGE
jgi:hypothetical protein